MNIVCWFTYQRRFRPAFSYRGPQNLVLVVVLKQDKLLSVGPKPQLVNLLTPVLFSEQIALLICFWSTSDPLGRSASRKQALKPAHPLKTSQLAREQISQHESSLKPWQVVSQARISLDRPSPARLSSAGCLGENQQKTRCRWNLTPTPLFSLLFIK